MLANAVRQYFRSGWAFLVPYLAAYLLYAAVDGPVRPGSDRPGPSLLTIYWTMHAAHLLLASWSARCAWGDLAGDTFRSAATRLVPWAALLLVFWIPGIYFEFPGDPWEHLSRINEWSWQDTISSHAPWGKPNYFLAFSVVALGDSQAAQLEWCKVYYSILCVLLCWQYYRLALASGLGRQAALVFVLLQPLLFGNGIFGFFRYYGLSGAMIAQIGAVALVRSALEAGRPDPFTRTGPAIRALGAGVLVLLIACNHVQGLGIAALPLIGFAGSRVARWRDWRRVATVVIAIVACVLVPVLVGGRIGIVGFARDAGWFSRIDGFDLVTPGSPARELAFAILGLPGLVNLAVGVYLLARGELVGWLTAAPVLLLSLPFLAVPLAVLLRLHGATDATALIPFSRMLFAIPSGLALVTAATRILEAEDKRARLRVRAWAGLLAAALTSLALLPAGSPAFNRLFNLLAVPPADLQMQHVLATSGGMKVNRPALARSNDSQMEEIALRCGGVLTTPGIGFVLNATGNTLIPRTRRWMTWPTISTPAAAAEETLDGLAVAEIGQIVVAPFPAVPHLFSPVSQAGLLSGHWLPQDVALEHATQAELFRHASLMHPTRSRASPQLWLESPGQPSNRGGDLADHQVDRRELPPLPSGRTLLLRPTLRTPDGNGWKLSLWVSGPDCSVRRDFFGDPTPLGGLGYLEGEEEIRLRTPGDYIIELQGTTLWPVAHHRVSYRLRVHSSGSSQP